MEATTPAQTLILRWDVDATYENLFDGEHRAEAERYLRAVKDIRRSESSSTSSVGKFLEIAMTRLQAEFKRILVTRVNHVDSDFLESSLRSISISSSANRLGASFAVADQGIAVNNSSRSSSSFVVGSEDDDDNEDADGEEEEEEDGYSVFEKELAPSDVIDDLRSIAKVITSGYSQECCQVYCDARKDSIANYLQLLGVTKLRPEEILRQSWETVDVMIRKWIHAFKVCLRLFSSEKRLCDLIFDGLDCDRGSNSTSLSEQAFAETAKGPCFQLLGFTEAIRTVEKSPEKLFKIIELCDALRSLLPEVEAIFCGPYCSSINSQVREILSQLEEIIRGIFSEFANEIQRHSEKTPIPGGTVHPITQYVMNYIILISEYKTVLSDIIISAPSADDDASSNLKDNLDDDDGERSPFAVHLVQIVTTLVSTLDSMSDLYRDPALKQVFIMNNTHYVVKKVKATPVLMEMIGKNYIKRLTGKYRSAATNYHRGSWVGVLNCLRVDGIHIRGTSSSSGISKTTLRERFKSFNAAFEESHRTQASWIVPDNGLKDELKIMISERLLPAYRSFYGRYHQFIESGRNPHLYIKYTGDDLERAIQDFFGGGGGFSSNPIPSHNPTRRAGKFFRG